MAPRRQNRKYDIVVFGATGYTGQLTAEHIASNLPTNIKWAVAGRSEAKLQTVVEDCKQYNADRTPPAIEIADIGDEESLKALAVKTKVLLSTVGPYCKYGEKVFKVCAESGTHYFDVTGESVWVASMIKKYDEVAKDSGAIMVPQIGVESAPSDLTTWLLAEHVRDELDADTKEVTISIHKLKGAPSGGTLATVLGLFDVFSLSELRAAFSPYALSPTPHTEKPDRQSLPLAHVLFGSHYDPHLGRLTTSLADSTDAAIVERTWGLLPEIPSRKAEFYGDKFVWKQYMKTDSWFRGLFVHWGLVWASVVLALLPPVRSLLKSLVTQPGGGPDRQARSKELLEYRGIAVPDDEETTKKAFAKARYDGSPYVLTGILLAEAAATVLKDDVKLDGGVYTPACLGQSFIDRLDDAGFHFEVETVEQ
ncbi:NAD(P)-binding domain [Cordyceps javanica]|uniref:NAD(P)-binding domain n=1 Tax=Cordyceps javanica TaxID=43265 RepID=A0A545VD07_9HYPO|nr:NAD(P)-binding domain [Cordyceps javanica]TQW10737.1 NAD(P)-binding domain [Cordyceps javanica]